MQVTKGHNGNTISHKGVVGVIPLWALGIHPDAGIGNKVADLCQQRDQHFL